MYLREKKAQCQLRASSKTKKKLVQFGSSDCVIITVCAVCSICLWCSVGDRLSEERKLVMRVLYALEIERPRERAVALVARLFWKEANKLRSVAFVYHCTHVILFAHLLFSCVKCTCHYCWVTHNNFRLAWERNDVAVLSPICVTSKQQQQPQLSSFLSLSLCVAHLKCIKCTEKQRSTANQFA